MTPAQMIDAGGVLWVGRCRVDAGARELTGPSSPRLRRVTPKAMAVLRCLARQPGQVVTREALLAGVWPDSAPTDDVLTQAITLLRKTFASLDDSQPYIETIARSGYRLLVTVRVDETVASPEVPAGETPSLPSSTAGTLSDDRVPSPEAGSPHARRGFRRRRRRWLFVVLLGLLLLSCAVLTVVLVRGGLSTVAKAAGQPAVIERPYRLLTSTLEAESDPALSPEGDQMAYVHPLPAGGSEILVQALRPNARPQPLDVAPVGAHDRQPVWSPDGRLVAFSRTLDDGRCAVLLARVGSGVPAQSLMRCDRTEQLSFDFTPDGEGLLFGSSEDVPGTGGIARLDIATREWTPLTYPREIGDLDHQPRVSPDGRWIVFARNPQLGQLWRMPVEGGALQPVGQASADPLRGFAWLPDSRHLLVTRWVGMELRLFKVDGLDESAGLGEDLGVDQAMMPTVARRAPVIGFVHRPLESRLMKVAADGRLTPLLAGRGQDLLPSVSPRGDRLVFISDRSGVPALWLGTTDGKGVPTLIPGLSPATQQPPAWSPDGQRVLAVGVDGHGRRSLYEIDPQNLGVVGLPLPDGEPLQAIYAGDSGQLLVVQRVDGRPYLRLYDRTRSPWALVAEVPGVSQARWDAAAGQVIVARHDRPGLFRLPADLGDAPLAIAMDWPVREDYRGWSVTAQGDVWVAVSTSDCGLALRHLPATQGDASSLSLSRCVSRTEPGLRSGFSGGLSHGPVIATGRNDGGEIGVMALPGTGSGQLSDGVKSLIGK